MAEHTYVRIPRAEIYAIAERYGDAFSLEVDPPGDWVRYVAANYRSQRAQRDR